MPGVTRGASRHRRLKASRNTAGTHPAPVTVPTAACRKNIRPVPGADHAGVIPSISSATTPAAPAYITAATSAKLRASVPRHSRAAAHTPVSRFAHSHTVGPTPPERGARDSPSSDPYVSATGHPASRATVTPRSHQSAGRLAVAPPPTFRHAAAYLTGLRRARSRRQAVHQCV